MVIWYYMFFSLPILLSFSPPSKTMLTMIARPMLKTRAAAFVIVLRVVAAVLCFCAAIVMVTSHESTTFFGITMDARFQYTPAFKFLVVATAMISAYSLIILFIRPTCSISRFIIATDVLAAMLLTGSLSAAGAIGYVGKKGSLHAGWLPICDQIPKFCDQTVGALVCNFVALLIYASIVFCSILKTHSYLCDCAQQLCTEREGEEETK